jgi:hypothetical protein
VASWYEAEVNVRFLLTLALCSWPALAQTNQDVEPNMSCVERLLMPIYPRLAQQAAITGRVTATVVVASDGSAQTTFSSDSHRFLSPAVDYALQKSSFRKSCGGKSVTLAFNFVLSEYYPDGRLQGISFGYPNQFSISALRPVVQP